MNADERYRRLTSGVTKEFRELAHRMLADPDMLPGRRELKAELARIVPDDHEDLAPVRDALEKQLVGMAHAAQDRSARFELRGRADNFALGLGDKLAARDRYVATPEPEAIDAGAVASEARKSGDPTGAEAAIDNLFKTLAQRVAELERQLQERS